MTSKTRTRHYLPVDMSIYHNTLSTAVNKHLRLAQP